MLLTRNDLHPFNEQLQTAALMLAVVAAAYGLMLGAGAISRLIGSGGASIVASVP